MRLDRILANSGYGSRTEVKQLIKEGRISLQDKVIYDPSLKVTESDRQCLALDGKIITTSENLYFLFNKVPGYITAMKDANRPTIYEFLPAYFHDKKVAPVGRLDKDTSGLLILTNDGMLNYRLLSPKYEIPRVYYLEVKIISHAFDQTDIERANLGLDIGNDEFSKSAKLEIISPTSAYITLTEGKYHEVKRIMWALGKEVIKLHRTSYGPLELNQEEPGTYRSLTDDEIIRLKNVCGLYD